MWLPFCLFSDAKSARIRTLRFEGGEFDRFRAQIEEQGPPAQYRRVNGPLTVCKIPNSPGKDPMERTGRWSCPEFSLSPTSISVVECPIWSRSLSQSLSSGPSPLLKYSSSLLYRFVTAKPWVQISELHGVESLTVVNV